ncbi:LmbE-like protein [Thozetella sp. PMI_491]|nr:LmbE-like protein [Thozetella sp. PMI_491]
MLPPAVARLAARLRANRRLWRWTVRIAVLAVVVPVLLQWILGYLLGSDTRLLPTELQSAKNLLIVTAHPDDECLFFSPAILGVLDRNRQINGGLIVMSTGNNEGIGETRKKELKGSCESLGINPARCIALDHAELQDNPKVWWNTDIIEGIVKDYVKKWAIDAIITFDEGGVSGHINHRAVSAAVSHYAATDPKAPPTYMLKTTWLIRKYTILGDLPLTALPFTWRMLEAVFFPTRTADASYGNKAITANSWGRYLRTRQAFRSHDTQYSWDRHLYMILSRYVWFNDLVRVAKAAN